MDCHISFFRKANVVNYIPEPTLMWNIADYHFLLMRVDIQSVDINSLIDIGKN